MTTMMRTVLLQITMRTKRISTNKPFNQHKLSNGHNNSGPPTVTLHCDNCGLNNHNSSDCRKPRMTQRSVNNNDIICYTCHKPGHKRSQCTMYKATHKTAAMIQVNPDRFSENRTHTRPHHCDDAQGCLLYTSDAADE